MLILLSKQCSKELFIISMDFFAFQIGRFAPSSDNQIKLTNCGGFENTVTHTSPSPKSGISLQWQAPSDFVGEIVFKWVSIYLPFSYRILNEDGFFYYQQFSTLLFNAFNVIYLLFKTSATVAQEYAKFWVGIESPVVNVVPRNAPIQPGQGSSSRRPPYQPAPPNYSPSNNQIVSLD